MKVLAYTSPARGHLNPMMGPLLELSRRGAEVHIRTIEAGVPGVREVGLACEPIDPRIEAVEMDDYAASSQIKAGMRNFAVWAERAPLEVDDFRAAVAATGPDLALVDTTTFGAKAAAEADGLVWAESRPFLLEDPAPGVPPFRTRPAPDERPARAHSRRGDGSCGEPVRREGEAAHGQRGREAAGLGPLADAAASRQRSPLTLYYTATPFEYERPMPPGVLMVGAATWDPPEALPGSIPDDDRPLVLVACSSEFQDDGAIAAAAIEGLAGDHRLVVTTAGVDPASLPRRGDVVVERHLPHSPLLERASVLVCHGGMGATQKALAHGVPACVIPWARDQLDVGVHVEEAGAGVVLPRKKLSPERLAEAVERTRRLAPGAGRVRDGYEATGGSAAAADAVERLEQEPAGRARSS